MIGSALAAAGLVAGALTMARPRRLPRAAPFEGHTAGQVSVVIPARNEAAALPNLLRSLEPSRPLVREVIVVDDHSHDATAEVAAAHGATVVRLDREPPPGWTGKTHACASGATAATAPVLLFLDADVVLARDAVARLLDALAGRGGLVSVQPFHTVRAPYEELSAGANLVSMMGSGAFAAWSHGGRPAAFGPCLMTSAGDYHHVGGHAAVRGDVVEDIALARRFRASGLPVNVFLGADAVSFRMYPHGFGQLVEGWTKNLAAGSQSAQRRAVVAASAWLIAALAIGVHGVRALVQFRSVTAADAAVAGLGWLAVTAHLGWMLRRIGSFRPWTAWLHPIPLWAFVGLYVRSLWLTTVRRSVIWSRRQIDLRRPVG